MTLRLGQVPAQQIGGGLVHYGDMATAVGRDDRAWYAGQGGVQPVPLQVKLRTQMRFFGGAGNGPFQADGRHMRLFNEIESACLHGRHRQGGIPMAGQEHNGSRRQADVPVQGFKHLEPAHVRQAVVDQHAIRLEILNGRQAGRAQFGLGNNILVRQKMDIGLAVLGRIIDDEDAGFTDDHVGESLAGPDPANLGKGVTGER